MATYRVVGTCLFLDDRQTVAAIPTGTLVEVVEEGDLVRMRWQDAHTRRRQQTYPRALWESHIRKELQPA